MPRKKQLYKTTQKKEEKMIIRGEDLRRKTKNHLSIFGEWRIPGTRSLLRPRCWRLGVRCSLLIGVIRIISRFTWIHHTFLF